MGRRLDQKGFSAAEAVLIVVIVGLVGFTGWFVWHGKQNTDKTLNAANKSAQTTTPKLKKTPTSTTMSTYTSPDYGFSFSYPPNWKLTTKLQDNNRGGLEGDIYVESPAGTKVHFGPGFGGKGGDCADDQANGEHTTRTCTTRKILSVDKLANGGTQPIWLLEASDTAPTDSGGQTSFFVYLSSATYDVSTNKYDQAPAIGSTLGAFLGTYDDIYIQNRSNNNGFVYLTVYVEGAEDSKNTSSSFFDTAEVKEALPVLQSLNIK